MPRPSRVDADLRPAAATPRRRFRGWVGRRSDLPPLAVPAGTAGRHLRVDGTDVARVRREAGDRLHGWGVAPTDVAAVRLVVSELVSHVVTHDHADRVAVTVVDRADEVTVVVEYACGPGRWAGGAPSPIAPATVGLTVVGRVAARWGHGEVPAGGRFWAVVAAPRAVVTSRRR